MLVKEAIYRLVSPPEVHTHHLLSVSVVGLIGKCLKVLRVDYPAGPRSKMSWNHNNLLENNLQIIKWCLWLGLWFSRECWTTDRRSTVVLRANWGYLRMLGTFEKYIIRYKKVNIIGLASFSHAHSHGGEPCPSQSQSHSHGHSHDDDDSHGHSHQHTHSHGHSHSAKNENMHGVYLHILADLLGSQGSTNWPFQ